ncbi:MAG: cysteine peptidase family C39 domain-containing protein [Persephonella sp.]|nr:cysteine peptidase family C39 domain-containing protein [Persephonella sp.]
MQRYILFLLLLFNLSYSITLNVPFVKQQSEFCGPAALSSVFSYYGLNISQEKIAEKVYIPELKGALISDLENYAKSSGFQTKSAQGNVETLKRYIDRKIPVIVLLDYGFLMFTKLHYVVITGYNEVGFIAHTGYEKNKLIPYRMFEKLWKKAGKVYLAVYR